MPRDFATLPDDTPPRPPLLQRMRALPTGSKILTGAGFLLFFSLFLTWQNHEVDFGQAGTSTEMLDGWDFWGLLIGFATAGLVTLVLSLNAWDVDLGPDVRWDLVVLAGAIVVFGLTLVKNLGDEDSAWASYLGVALAGVMVGGAYLDWLDARSRRSLRRRRRRRRLSSAA